MGNGQILLQFVNVRTENSFQIIMKYFYTAIDCETLSNPENGFVSVNGVTIGAIATYGCNPGFILVGRRVRICRNDGQYSGVEPVCRGMKVHFLSASFINPNSYYLR